jgi:glycosidase
MKIQSMLIYLVVFLVFFLGVGVGYMVAQTKRVIPPVRSEVKHVDWSKNAVIYEVNIRQFSKEGTFAAFERDLPRLKKMGIEILWIMPVNPIGIKNRKEPLGSYYSVKDYQGINSEFGTMDDFKHMVKAIHATGMKVVLDWVPNHTSWDNDLVTTHPEYYLKDSVGKFVSAFDWTDVIRLDYKNPALRNYMIYTMKWWIIETDIDGFRCDVAHMVPTDFWDQLRPELEALKPVFMLAEADIPAQHQKGYDMSYDWKFFHLMNDIAAGKKNANAIMKHFNWVDSVYPANSYLMEFTSNHDENSWNGTEYERMGKGAQTFAVLSATIQGMPLIYNGQESGFNRRLKFFERDPIDWETYSLTPFYRTLISLKKRNRALWNGEEGGKIQRITTSKDSSVFAFVREKGAQKVFVVCNLSGKQLEIKCNNPIISGKYLDVFTSENRQFEPKCKLVLKPWEYFVFEKTE